MRTKLNLLIAAMIAAAGVFYVNNMRDAAPAVPGDLRDAVADGSVVQLMDSGDFSDINVPEPKAAEASCVSESGVPLPIAETGASLSPEVVVSRFQQSEKDLKALEKAVPLWVSKLQLLQLNAATTLLGNSLPPDFGYWLSGLALNTAQWADYLREELSPGVESLLDCAQRSKTLDSSANQMSIAAKNIRSRLQTAMHVSSAMQANLSGSGFQYPIAVRVTANIAELQRYMNTIDRNVEALQKITGTTSGNKH